MTTVLDVLAAICLLGGAALSLAAAVGVVRFPDVLSRMHAASKPQVLGLLLVLIGVGLRLRTQFDITTLVLVAVFQLTTAPVAAHMVGRAAYRTRRLRRDLLIVDELGERLDAGREGGPPGPSDGPGRPDG
ncbi:monovalent cation/H(+) antiporter subunit G [Patulibacter americanus]|uniref:monovalent cation/H(+) antiporter subunit G n=1 Tax=Patulibacter americanus TaxID=588672 RepID=UPI0003B48FAD|nr:monovalent cation/H(+) antiporter subunit G [Patulibacter americanus]